MKKILLTMGFVACIGLAVFAQEATESGAKISFQEEVHDFGTINQNTPAVTNFVFVNTGTKPLVISNARGSCGCTVPEWPKEPIQPGDTSAIKVKYDSSRLGAINKTVTITSNATNEPTKVIRIKGNIITPPSGEEE